MKILTIIVPVYNMEKYLHKCLSSVIVSNKELLEQLDVIIVNDGSKDNSSAIAHQYEDKYPRTFRVIDKENGNYGSCINVALPAAKGKYVKVLDADDRFDTDVFERTLSELLAVDTDMFVTNFVEVDEFDDVIFERTMSGVLKEKEILPFHTLVDDGNFITIWMYQIIYRTSIFRQIDYHQTEGISYTDNEWSVLPLLNVHNIYYFPEILYYYLVGRSGQTMDKCQIIKKSGDFVQVLYSMLNFFVKYNNETTQCRYIYNCIIRFAVGRVYRMSLDEKLMAKERLREVDFRLKQDFPIFYRQLSNQKVAIDGDYFPIKYWQWHILWLFNNPLMKIIRQIRIKLNLGKYLKK